MEKRTKKKKRKRKRSGRKGRVHRGVPTFPQHNAASFLHMPAGGCRLNRQGCTLCVCPRVLDHTCTHLLHFKVSMRIGEKTKSKTKTSDLQNRLLCLFLPPPAALVGVVDCGPLGSNRTRQRQRLASERARKLTVHGPRCNDEGGAQ